MKLFIVEMKSYSVVVAEDETSAYLAAERNKGQILADLAKLESEIC